MVLAWRMRFLTTMKNGPTQTRSRNFFGIENRLDLYFYSPQNQPRTGPIDIFDWASQELLGPRQIEGD